MAFSPIPYTLLRSKRKTLCIEIREDCTVLVRAPLRCPQKTIEAFLEDRRSWIAEHLALQKARAEAHPEPSAAEKQEYIRRAETELPLLVKRYAALMGLTPAGITVTGAEKRFGSCSAKNRLCFSWRLMAYPRQAVEYVVVHELAHIVHKNHGPDFYALIKRYLPDHEARRKLLKK